MKRIAIFLVIAMVGLSCGREDEGPPERAGGPPETQGPAKKPIEYWVAQAEATGGPEDLAATVKALNEALADPAPEVRVAAGDALGVLGPKAAAAAATLVGRLEDGSAWMRMSAMETLAQIGPGAVGPLVDAVEKGKGPIRVRSVIVLGSLGADAKAAIATLEKLSKMSRSRGAGTRSRRWRRSILKSTGSPKRSRPP